MPYRTVQWRPFPDQTDCLPGRKCHDRVQQLDGLSDLTGIRMEKGLMRGGSLS